MIPAGVNRFPIRCLSCDALLPSGALSCPICRRPTRLPVVQRPEPKVCQWCGAAAPAESRHCPVCGIPYSPSDKKSHHAD